MLLALVFLPILLGGIAFVLPSERHRPWLLPLGGAAHLGLTATAIARRAPPMLSGYLVLDSLGTLVLGFTSVLFFLCFLYAPGYLKQRAERPNRVFVACLLVFVGTTSLILLTHHLGLMWVALEATTLCSAPLLYFNHNARSLEAVWKYLLVGSVGIALALLGSLFLLRCSSTTSSAMAPRFPGHGCTPPSSSSSWATARRWALRRCTRGSLTRTAKRLDSSARSWREG